MIALKRRAERFLTQLRFRSFLNNIAKRRFLEMIALVLLVMVSAGCSVKPVTDGMHVMLPEAGTRTTVWGNDMRAIQLAATWLKKRDLEIIDSALLHGKTTNHLFNHKHSFADEQAVLQQAQAHNIPLVVFVERTGDLRAPFLAVKGVDSITARILWSGNARYPSFLNSPLSHLIVNLTCQSLATAWGFREPGTLSSLSNQDMCEIEP